ncbi:MAG: hypothetical protein DRO67_00275 [Candidatus Asgardarchaeum californiense]|nr:MAG: hypothetical protein DRO67_00275 [Candidatus Asgardarchaeum californiense]
MKNKSYIEQFIKHDVEYIKNNNLILKKLTDNQVMELYKEWSNIQGGFWLTLNKRSMATFEEWLFNTPFDLYIKKYGGR